jgi:hypothetical protein
MIKKIIIFLILIVIILLAGAYLYRNSIVKSAVETGGEYALGVNTNLGSANLDIGGGNCSLHNFEVSNPDGFEADKFITLKKGILAVETGSILEDEVVIDSLVIEGLRLNFEQIDKKGNYKAILDHINNLDFGESSSSSETMLKVKRVAIRDIAVDASLTLLGEKRFEKSFTIDNFTITDLGTDPKSVKEITARIFKAVISRAAAESKNYLPVDLDKLKEAGKQKLESEARKKIGELGKGLLGK